MGRMGRKSKGERGLVICRPSLRLSEAVRAEARKRNLSISDYAASALAEHLGMPEEAPIQPERAQLPMTG